MQRTAIETISPGLKLIDTGKAIPGYGQFIGSYLCTGEKNAIIDIGPKACLPGVLDALDQLEINPAQIDYIILSHIHLDHAGGAGTALKLMNKARVIAHPRGTPHLADPAKLWQASLTTLGDVVRSYGEIEPMPADRIVGAAEGMEIDLGNGRALKVVFTPGHAAHSISFFSGSDRILLAGEAAGDCIGGMARPATPPPFKLDAILDSVDKLIALNPATICYAHYGCFGDAVARLEHYRNKIKSWYDIINSTAGKGLDNEGLFNLMKQKDRELDYLNTLGKEEYHREHVLILNSILGISNREPIYG